MTRGSLVIVALAALTLPGTPAATSAAGARTAGVHTGIPTTVFWVGEAAGPDNGYISNAPSAWQDDWTSHFGGVDDPKRRSGYRPRGFTPRENPFYVALPYFDYDANGRLKKNVTKAPWYDPAHKPRPGQSTIKNSWVRVSYRGRTAYGQWEDVGPFHEDDVRYVFGTARPRHRVGLDVSPAMSDYLRMGDTGTTTWQFVRADHVPDGPWKEIVTTSGTDWR